ncbi:MAG: alanine racemase [Oscillospiraceae bacterium]|jgi:alanine racemase|nr:alanine racemase [Oscillospiraceae bacterium]
MSELLKRTWAKINLDDIEHNYRLVRNHVAPSVLIMCIVKADAYGHGVRHISLLHQELGADWFGVSNLEEALQIREIGIFKPVLILGYTPPNRASDLSKYCFTQSVFSEEYAQELSACAKEANCTIDCHIKFDSGMTRLGLSCRTKEQIERAADAAERICALPNLKCTGAFTHFSVADEGESQREFTYSQYDKFSGVLTLLEERGIKLKLRHCCNSAATLEYSQFHMDMVRPGIILYGLKPSGEFKDKYDLRPAMEIKSVISMIKQVEEGAFASYGRTYEFRQPSVVATIPIGYADGYPRLLSSSGEVTQDMLVQGKRAPVVGRVCMDQLLLDVSRIENVRAGMTVTVFGRDKEAFIPVDELSEKAGTINYETVCLVGKRVPRTYQRNGKTVAQVNYIID